MHPTYLIVIHGLDNTTILPVLYCIKLLINKYYLWLFMIHIHSPRRFSFNSPRKRTGSEFQTSKPITPNTDSTVFHHSPIFQLLNPNSLCQMCSLLRIGHYHRQIQSVSRAVNVTSVKFVIVFFFW